MDSIDRRMQSFVEWYGEVPPDAKRLEDFDAREHAATWLRHNVGKGVAGAYVIAFQRGAAWWSYFFERIDEDDALEGADAWRVEAYNSSGRSWSRNYLFWLSQNRWTRSIPGSSWPGRKGKAPNILTHLPELDPPI